MNTTTFHGMTRAAALSMIWNDTHPDFRGSAGAVPRTILTARGLVALTAMDDAEVSERVALAIRGKNLKAFSGQGLIVNPRLRGVWSGATDQHGTAFVVNLLTGECRKVSEHQDKPTHEARMVAAFMASEKEADNLARLAA